IREAKRLSIPVLAMVVTCCDPTIVDYVIPANDDATKSIAVILETVTAAIAEGLTERKLEKEKEADAEPKDKPAKSTRARKTTAVKEEAAASDADGLVETASQGVTAESSAEAATETVVEVQEVAAQ
ncbi:MAG: 30S ribosomal protein S2, partial [Rikenellaceae bacterium]|nr:30S ribosomal protein S2 [Rikenellaceae bacterium]